MPPAKTWRKNKNKAKAVKKASFKLRFCSPSRWASRVTYTEVSLKWAISNPSSEGIVCKSKICAAISHLIRQPSPAAPSTCSSSMPSLEHWNGNETVLPADSNTMNSKMYHGTMDLSIHLDILVCLGKLCEALGSWLCGTSIGHLIATVTPCPWYVQARLK